MLLVENKSPPIRNMLVTRNRKTLTLRIRKETLKFSPSVLFPFSFFVRKTLFVVSPILNLLDTISDSKSAGGLTNKAC